MARKYADDAQLTSLQRQAAISALEAVEQQLQLGQLACWLDDRDEPRAAAMIMSAQRSILACAHLVAPATETQLQDVIEQRAPADGSHSAW